MPEATVIKASGLEGRTGRGVRVAVIDTGIHPNHPHLGAIEGAVAFNADGTRHEDVVDRVGHGTAVAAVIHEKAAEAAIIGVKIFDRGLVTTSAALVAAIRWSIEAGVDLINLSLGSTNEDRRDELASLVAEAARRKVAIVAAAPTTERVWLPGALSGVIAVELDWTCPRDECLVIRQDDGETLVRASGYPRPIPGVPPERNIKGQSFAVANATGLFALVQTNDC
jgi:hypothetical protein